MHAVVTRMRARGLPLIDVALAAALLIYGVAEWGTSLRHSGEPGVTPVVIVAVSLLMLGRQRWPIGVAVVSLVILAATESVTHQFTKGAWPVMVILAVSYTLGAHVAGRRLWLGVVPVTVLALVTFFSAATSRDKVGDFLFVVCVAVGGPVLGGRLLGGQIELTRELRARNAQLEAEREERARRAVADERSRIARELHDVVAHSVSVMVVQAGGARRMLPIDPPRAERSFAAIESTGRTALGEMRRLLGILKPEGEAPALEPQPGMGELEDLVERARAAGLAVELRVEGRSAPLAGGVDLAAYRVVQEALTNVVKHARGARTLVSVTYGDEQLVLEVVDDGAGAPLHVNGSGQGLIGMRERVAVYGGTLEAGPADDGGFAVRATFPLAGVLA